MKLEQAIIYIQELERLKQKVYQYKKDLETLDKIEYFYSKREPPRLQMFETNATYSFQSLSFNESLKMERIYIETNLLIAETKLNNYLLQFN